MALTQQQQKNNVFKQSSDMGSIKTVKVGFYIYLEN